MSMATKAEIRPRVLRAGTALLVALVLAGCQGRSTSFRQQLGLDQAPPDEFLVITKAPLTVPPNMELVPPDPGAPPTATANNPALAAETAALGTPTARAAGASSGEAALLARAGTAQADPRIRRRLQAESLAAAEANETVTGSLLNIQRDKEETLDPEEEAKRLRKRRTGRKISAEDILSPRTN
jgi:hypothetical protein